MTKSTVLFGMGAILTALCILTDQMFLPYLAGMLFYGCSYLLYLLIPAVGKGSLFKYQSDRAYENRKSVWKLFEFRYWRISGFTITGFMERDHYACCVWNCCFDFAFSAWNKF